MFNRKQVLLRLSEVFAEASQLLKLIADHESPVSSTKTTDSSHLDLFCADANTPMSWGEDASANNENFDSGSHPTIRLIQEKGVYVKNLKHFPPEANGLLTLAGIMGQKIRTIRPLIDQIKRAQSSRRRIFMDLSNQPQEAVADITLVAGLANKAGLLPNYRYSRSPSYKLSANSPVSPIAINFFTGQWLELYALKTIRDIEDKYGTRLYPLSQVHVQLLNGDQFELDLLLTVNGRLLWVEAKTCDDFERLLPKYKGISEQICESKGDAILLWSSYSSGNAFLASRGAVARMTLCGPDEFPAYVADSLTHENEPGTNDNELA